MGNQGQGATPSPEAHRTRQRTPGHLEPMLLARMNGRQRLSAPHHMARLHRDVKTDGMIDVVGHALPATAHRDDARDRSRAAPPRSPGRPAARRQTSLCVACGSAPGSSTIGGVAALRLDQSAAACRAPRRWQSPAASRERRAARSDSMPATSSISTPRANVSLHQVGRALTAKSRDRFLDLECIAAGEAEGRSIAVSERDGAAPVGRAEADHRPRQLERALQRSG